MKKLLAYIMPLAAILCTFMLFSCKSNLEMPESPDEKFSSSGKSPSGKSSSEQKSSSSESNDSSSSESSSSSNGSSSK